MAYIRSRRGEIVLVSDILWAAWTPCLKQYFLINKNFTVFVNHAVRLATCSWCWVESTCPLRCLAIGSTNPVRPHLHFQTRGLGCPALTWPRTFPSQLQILLWSGSFEKQKKENYRVGALLKRNLIQTVNWGKGCHCKTNTRDIRRCMEFSRWRTLTEPSTQPPSRDLQVRWSSSRACLVRL